MRPPSIEELRHAFSDADEATLPRLVRKYAKDEREGVRDLVARARSRMKASRAEDERLERLASYQTALHEQGYVVVAGVDEVGRGALAGPLTACAVILPVTCRIRGLDDSKALLPERRVELAEQVRAEALAVSVAHVEPGDLDALGMTAANRGAMRSAIDGLGVEVEHVLVDGIDDHLGLPCTAVVDGDAKVACIAAASIVAKVTRDALMRELDAVYPGWGFARHKGYSTAEHKAAIDRLGLSPVHRRSFSPCAGVDTLFDLD